MRSKILVSVGFLLISFFLIVTITTLEGIKDVNEATAENKSSMSKRYFAKLADTTTIKMKTDGIKLGYSVTEIQAKAGDILRIQYINNSDMNHNIVLVGEEADIRPVGVAALQAMASDWIPEKEMQRIIAYSKLAYSGDTIEFIFKVPPPGIYPYICTYSAHWTQMQGRLISTK